jgi:uncharacterized membrane protein
MWLIAIGALVFAIHALSRVREIEKHERHQRALLDELLARLRKLETSGPPMAESGAEPQPQPRADPALQPEAARAVPPRAGPAQPPAATAVPSSADAAPPSPTPHVPPAGPELAPPSVAPAPRVPPPPSVPPPPRVTPGPQPGAGPSPDRAAPRPDRVGPSPDRAAPPPDREAPPPGRATPPPDRAAPPPRPPRQPPARPSIDWEDWVGVKLFSWIAGVALVFAAVFFLRYSVDQGWLTPPIRMAIGLLVGVGLLVGCELPAARRYWPLANALDAAGVATLFATLFASHALWHLIPQSVTFVSMALVAAVAVVLSIRRDSVFISLLGLLGGFATPILLSTGENRPIGLFGYLLVLNVGLAWVAYQRGWVVLTIGSIVLTVLYQWAWVFRFLDETPLPLAMAIFLVFPAVQMGALLLAGRGREEAQPTFGRMAVASAVVPLLFGLYLAAVPAYGAHTALLFGFVLVVSAGLAVVASVRGPDNVHLVGALGTVLAFVVWCAMSYTHDAWPGILGWVAGGVALYLVAPWAAARLGHGLGLAGQHARLAAPALLAVVVFLAAVEPATASPAILFGTLLALVTLIAATSILSDDGGPHFLGAPFAVAAQVAWSARNLEPHRLYAALTLYAVFGLFYVAVPLIADRFGRRLAPGAGTAATLVASIGLVLFLAVGPVAHVALLGIGALLAVFVAMLFLPLVAGPFPLLRIVGIVLAWLVLALWWATAMTAALLLPSLLVVAGLGMLVVMGNAWLGTRADRQDGSLAHGLRLAIVVHLFLLRIATDRELGIPPWPWLGVLAVVDLAIATASLAIRDGRPHRMAIVLSQIVILAWGSRAANMPWPLVTIGAADAIALLAIVWIELGRRRDDAVVFARGAVAAVMLAQLAAVVAAEADEAPAVAWLAADHAVLLVALLAIAERMRWPSLRLLALVPAILVSGYWVANHVPPASWQAGLVIAAVPFLVFVVDALRRPSGEGAMASLQAAVVSAVAFLVLARHCLRAGELEGIMGIVPVAQALVMLVLLRGVLARREGPLAGDARVALVAAAALGFATAAIPLQLSLEHVTVALALETTALAWLYRRIRFPQLVLWIAGIAAAVFVRLALNPAVLTYHPRSAAPILNWYLYLYLVSAVSLFAAAALLRGTEDRLLGELRLTALLPTAATVLLFLIVNIEIADYYSSGTTLTFNFFSASLAQDLTYTLAWALFAIGLLVAGIRMVSRFVRVAALALLSVTIVKCFLHDLWRLGGLYRVGSFVGLAICLSVVALLLQRFVFVPKEERDDAVAREPA